MDSGTVVDAVGDLGIEVPKRIVGQGGKVDDGVKSGEVSFGCIPDVASHLGGLRQGRTKSAVPVVVSVHTDHVNAPFLERGDHHGADETPVTSDQNPHGS